MKDIHEKIKKALNSKVLVRISEVVAVVILIVLIFAAGVSVGFHKASFGHAWEENYNTNFGMRGIEDNFPNAHGAAGKIIKIELPNIIVQGKDSTEKTISIANDTNIESGRNAIMPAALKIDDFVVVIGTPDDQGIIEAKLIRVIPSPEFLK